MSPKKLVVVSLPSRVKNAYQLLAYVCKLITAEPLRYNQGRYIARPNGLGGADKEPSLGFPACGTVGCVAGWVATLKGPKLFTYEETDTLAKDILGLTDSQAWELFSPAPISRLIYASKHGYVLPQTELYAKFGVQHIQAFMQKHSKQLKAKEI